MRVPFRLIGGILCITSHYSCETKGFVWVSNLSPYFLSTYIDFPILSHPIMSTASTVTTSVACNLTLGNEHEIANHICILVATQSDGTPFPHYSFQEEDLMELCMGLGQAHMDCVLWLWEPKAVITFWSTSELTAVTYLFGVATVLHDEPIRLYLSSH